MKYSLSALALAGLGAAQSVCPGVATVTVVPNAVEYPLEISTYISANTVINVNGNNDNIIINNAPTNLVTTVTGTSTVFSTVTAGAGAGATPAVTSINEAIILAINNNAAAKNKRQAGYLGYLGQSGAVAAQCQSATTLSLLNGELFTSAGLQFSTSPGVPYGVFTANPGAGSIVTTFGVDGVLVWDNANFTGGSASFCTQQSSNTIQAVFGVAPADCEPITFTALLASSCAGLNATSGAASATGASTTMSVSNTISASISATSAASSAISAASSAASSISSSLSSVLSSISTPPVSPVTSSVSLAFSAPAAGATKMAKRQTAGTVEYVTNQGTFTNNQSDAAIFDLVNGQLFSAGIIFSVNPGVPYQQFIAGAGGSIDTTFSNNPFTWTNQSFSINSAGTAEFAISAGTVFAAFQTIPPGATAIAITAQAATASTSSAATSSAAASSSTATSSTSTNPTSAASSASSVASSIQSSLSSVSSSSSVALTSSLLSSSSSSSSSSTTPACSSTSSTTFTTTSTITTTGTTTSTAFTTITSTSTSSLNGAAVATVTSTITSATSSSTFLTLGTVTSTITSTSIATFPTGCH